MTIRVALVPGVPALLPAYASRVDPVADLRAACLDAVRWLAGAGARVLVVADPQGRRVATYLLSAVGAAAREPGGAAYDAVLVVGNGSARRSEKAPGHLDERALDFDETLGAALRSGDAAELGELDLVLGVELLASVTGLAVLAEHLSTRHRAEVRYEDDPFGVKYWVLTWDPEGHRPPPP